MRILIIHTKYQFKGGEDSVVLNESNLLASENVVVSHLIFSNTGGVLWKVAQLPFNLRSYFATVKKIEEFKPDVVHIHNLHFAASAAVIYAIGRFKIPIVLTIHNYRMLCPSATLFYNGRIYTESLNKTFSWDVIRKGVYQNSSLLTFWVSCSLWIHHLAGTYRRVNNYIVLGQYTKDMFANSKLNYIVDQMVIKPNFCFGEPVSIVNSRDYYVYVGRLSEEKGIKLLLQAFAHNGLALKIAGTGPLEKDVLWYTRSFPNITFAGSLDQPGVKKLIKNAKALMFTSLWYETFGMVIIEAFSCGVPVIAANLGQLKYTITHGVNGLLFKNGDEKDLNNKIALYESLPEQDKLNFRKSALQSFDEHYSPEINKHMLLKVYNDLIKK